MNIINALLDGARSSVKKSMRQVARGINRLSGGRISPNMITLTGFLAHIPIAYLIAQQQITIAAVLLVVFGLLDTLDGELARLQKTDSRKGMLLDSVTDRMKEVMLYVGVSYYFVAIDKPLFAVWAVAACGAALTVSYINAWGEVVTAGITTKDHKKNSTFRSGLMTFDIRMLSLVLALASGRLEAAVVIIALLSWLTALQRLNNVSNKL